MDYLHNHFIAPGSGFVITPDGQLAIDFSQMPTDKFEEMLQQLRVPIWLSKNTAWYVDGENGSDVVTGVQDKGQTLATAFKTVNAAAQFVCSNYNFGSFQASIRITDGEYPESIILPYYNSTTGFLSLYGAETWGLGETTIKMTNGTGFTISAQTGGGRTNVNGIHLVRELDTSGTSTNGKGCIEINSGASVYIYGGSLNVFEKLDSVGSPQLVRARGGQLNIQQAITFTATSNKALSNIYGLYVDNGSGNISHNGDVSVSGNFGVFCRVDGGRFQRSSANPIFIPVGTVTGTRYVISSYGVIATRGGGSNFFPGDAPGNIQANNQYT